jgi:hypothetical protein
MSKPDNPNSSFEVKGRVLNLLNRSPAECFVGYLSNALSAAAILAKGSSV